MKSRYLICEGKEDLAFFTELARVRLLPEFQISYIGQHQDTGPGIDALVHHPNVIVGIRDFKQDVQHVVLLADNDEDQDKTFAKIVSHIKNANGSADVNGFYDIPKHPFVTSSGKTPTFTVILQPGPDEPGCLETLLWKYIARAYNKQSNCVEELLVCGGIDKAGWTRSKTDKARVRAAIAIIYRENPGCSVSMLWERNPALIPLVEPEFTPVWDLLRAI